METKEQDTAVQEARLVRQSIPHTLFPQEAPASSDEVSTMHIGPASLVLITHPSSLCQLKGPRQSHFCSKRSKSLFRLSPEILRCPGDGSGRRNEGTGHGAGEQGLLSRVWQQEQHFT